MTAEAGNNEKDDKLLVYVVGAVKEPGVYELPKGSHYYDAVKAAGDVLPVCRSGSCQYGSAHRKQHEDLHPAQP